MLELLFYQSYDLYLLLLKNLRVYNIMNNNDLMTMFELLLLLIEE
jgi:hypothetical protein